MPLRKKWFSILFLMYLVIIFPKVSVANNLISQAKEQLEAMLNENEYYLNHKGKDFFQALSKGQHPKITIVGCSDSRVQMTQFDPTPEGDVFVIRNIGNQIITTIGSVKYGVLHLHTPLLLIVGHSQCGAIAEVNRHQKNLGSAIVKELSTIHIHSGESNIQGVITNVNHQVNYATRLFHEQIKQNKLLVVGAVFDFTNEMHKGAGKLNVINIQGMCISCPSQGKESRKNKLHD
jgi:carbonic anhydrase